MLPRQRVGPDGNDKGGNVSRHVPAISIKGHRMELQPANDFDHHHHAVQRQDAPGAFFRAGEITAEIVAMLPACNICRVHIILSIALCFSPDKYPQLHVQFNSRNRVFGKWGHPNSDRKALDFDPRPASLLNARGVGRLPQRKSRGNKGEDIREDTVGNHQVEPAAQPEDASINSPL